MSAECEVSLMVQVDANNAQLLEQHVCCASAELPVTLEGDGQYFGPGLSAAMDSLVAHGRLMHWMLFRIACMVSKTLTAASC